MEDRAKQENGKMKWRPLIFITLAHLMVILDTTIMIVALPSIQNSLRTSATERQWIITAYTLAFAGLLLLGGRLADRFGARRTLITGAIGFAVSSVLGGIAPNIVLLILARAIEGCFGALLVSSTKTSLALVYKDKQQRAKAMGVFSATLALGGAIGFILGGVLTSMINWRWCLFINFPISIVVIIGVIVTLPNFIINKEVHIDVIGAAVFCVAIVSLVYGFGEIPSNGWMAPNVFVSIGVCFSFVVLFLLIQRKLKNPLLPLRLVTERNRAGSYIASIFNSLGSFGMELILTYQLQKIMHYSAMLTGFALIPFMLSGAAVAAFLSPHLMRKIKPKWLIAGGVLTSGLGLLPLMVLKNGMTFWPLLLCSEILQGVGSGLVGAPSTFTTLRGVESEDVGIASSASSAAAQIGASIGTASFNTIAVSVTAAYAMSHAVSSTNAAATAQGFMVASGSGFIILFVVSVVVFSMINAPVLAQ